MKIRYQCINALERIARIDENIRPSRRGKHTWIFRGDCLERAAACRPDGNDTPSPVPGGPDLIGSLAGKGVPLRVHNVFCYFTGLDRTKSTESDMKCQFGYRYPHCFDCIQDFRGEVEPG